MRLHIIQHVPFETAAGVQRWALAQGFQIETTFGDLVEEYPTVDCFDALVVMGGPMGVYESDRFPWLLEELALVRRATAAGKKVLGICLGAQIIAEALGGKVYPGPVKEIGWFPARLTAEGRKAEVLAEFPDTFSPLHWHGDTFDLPRDAVRLIETDQYPNQAFAVGTNVLGLQFHLEAGPADAAHMCEHLAADLADGPFVQRAEQILDNAEAFAVSDQLLAALLERFFLDNRK